MFKYRTRGTCSSEIRFEIHNDIVEKIVFIGGCPGNTQGVARLAEGRSIDELIPLLSGIDCAGRGTSCPDQLAKALATYQLSSAKEDVKEENTSDDN